MDPRPSSRFAVVITSIYQPSKAVLAIAEKNAENSFDFIVAADQKSPVSYDVENCIYYTLSQQREGSFRLGAACPTGHYARKNLGYLLAIARGCKLLIETDDDNIPLPGFWEAPSRIIQAPALVNDGWVNVYRYFTDALIWPRGLPLDAINQPIIPVEDLPSTSVDCPIQQGLADENPDVDAIYRLVLPLPQSFFGNRRIALGQGSWCPFNSQNTIWFSDAFPLLYLPAYCSFRMTDIWRSFVAQRIAWENNWSVLFCSSTVYQERNEHNLMRDFSDEVSGYLGNASLCKSLQDLSLAPGAENIPDNMLCCYRQLVDLELVDRRELDLLQLWLNDLASISG